MEASLLNVPGTSPTPAYVFLGSRASSPLLSHCSPTTQEGFMVCDTACRSILITISLLLVCSALSSAQSGKRRQQEPRGVSVAPAPFSASAPERRVALVIGNS